VVEQRLDAVDGVNEVGVQGQVASVVWIGTGPNSRTAAAAALEVREAFGPSAKVTAICASLTASWRRRGHRRAPGYSGGQANAIGDFAQPPSPVTIRSTASLVGRPIDDVTFGDRRTDL